MHGPTTAIVRPATKVSQLQRPVHTRPGRKWQVGIVSSWKRNGLVRVISYYSRALTKQNRAKFNDLSCHKLFTDLIEKRVATYLRQWTVHWYIRKEVIGCFSREQLHLQRNVEIVLFNSDYYLCQCCWAKFFLCLKRVKTYLCNSNIGRESYKLSKIWIKKTYWTS